jgi:RNA polymerase sigma-70 factor (ECF subfamily)
VSDIVQQTLLEAWKAWDRFTPRGDPRSARQAWLRQVLAHQLAACVGRYLGTQKRDVRREFSIDQSPARTSRRLERLLVAEASSPSMRLQQHEHRLRLAAVLERLTDDDREVIVRRKLQEQSHAEIARRMGRSEGAVRMPWVRALARLKRALDADALS